MQNQAPGSGKKLSPISFGPWALPEIMIVSSIVSIKHGIAFAKFEVITSFPVDLICRFAVFADSRK